MFTRAAAGRVTVRPGARELLNEVTAASIPYALVTSSEREFAEAVIGGAGFHFPVTVTADEVANTKPDPAPYLLAAKLLDVPPEHCVALEDSLNGVTSATAAGCKVIAVPSLMPIPQAPGRLVVPSLSAINLGTLRALTA
jgi:HAD superfamily hydrolase (TIGR01509 family)